MIDRPHLLPVEVPTDTARRGRGEVTV